MIDHFDHTRDFRYRVHEVFVSRSTANFAFVMPKTLLEASELAALIQPDILAGQGFPRPERVVLVERRDSTDLESYFIYLVYPKTVPDEALRRSKTGSMQDWARQTIYDHAGYDRFPYVRVMRPSEVPSGF